MCNCGSLVSKVLVFLTIFPLVFVIERIYLKHPVYVTKLLFRLYRWRANRYAEGIRISPRFLKNYIRPNFVKLLSSPTVDSLCLRGPAGVSSWTKRFASFRDSGHLSFSRPRRCRHHRRRLCRFYPEPLSGETRRTPKRAILRERFAKCTYGLIYSILPTPPEIFAEIFCMNARDYGDAIAINRIRYDVILHSVSSTDPTSIRCAISWLLPRVFSHFSLIRFNIRYNIYSIRFYCAKYEIWYFRNALFYIVI